MYSGAIWVQQVMSHDLLHLRGGFSKKQFVKVAAFLLAADTGCLADTAMRVIVFFTFIRTGAGCGGTGENRCFEQIGGRFCHTRQDCASGVADIGTVLIDPDTIDHRGDVLFAETGVGTGGACLGADMYRGYQRRHFFMIAQGFAGMVPEHFQS